MKKISLKIKKTKEKISFPSTRKIVSGSVYVLAATALCSGMIVLVDYGVSEIMYHVVNLIS